MEVKESPEKGVFVKGMFLFERPKRSQVSTFLSLCRSSCSVSIFLPPADLSTFTVKSPDDLLKILKVGQKQRKVGATKMNEGSSRSHSILTITIESSEKSKDKEGNETVSYKVGKLNMVDLAGSERQKKTEASGDRLDEAKSINWSLTVLGNCIKVCGTDEAVFSSIW
jgi:hypothetical protein